MAIFEIKNSYAKRIKLSEFTTEKKLQELVEKNLKEIFNCRFIATEFSTGNIHSGRIDTLAISEDNNPVIIEYKKSASSDQINQSLYYLHWIQDHKGDFQVEVNKALNERARVDWSEIRVICLAPEFKKYDIHAVQVMNANIELWQYKFYENSILSIEEVFRRTKSLNPRKAQTINGKNPIMVEAGKKAALTRKTAVYSIEDHYKYLNQSGLELFNTIRDHIISLDDSIEESPKKHYIAYKTSQNFVCLEAHKRKIKLYLKVDPDEIKPFPIQGRNVRNIGHFGTGDFELTINSLKDFEETKRFIKDAYQNIGG